MQIDINATLYRPVEDPETMVFCVRRAVPCVKAGQVALN